MKIISTKEMPLLGRKRVTALEDVSAATPSNISIKKKLSESLKINEELIALRHIYQQFGQGSAKIIAHIYNSKEDLEKIEGKKKNAKEKSKKQSTK